VVILPGRDMSDEDRYGEEQAKKKKRAARKKASAANRSKVRPARHEKRPRVVVTPASHKGARQ
jgi:hypothetical protein